ncbi:MULTISPECIES: fimbrial protein [unclassified Pseudomonas]|uniref:fimbrial protein n=1 Tax=unclassified Pseudomonas TaxID=196821 RepID=UPI000F55B762|nr:MULTISPECIES: fimbrial protein [unclassified Pseudomonas]AZF03587.1 Fimbrial protein precursor [Pseudomonas sp. R5-89-07]AZF46058.1 Fimbrial protein precursor [Pseudomonas sp. R2-7-07]
MSNSLKTLLAIAVSGFIANSAMAADGVINFTGEIVAVTCDATGGSTGGNASAQNIDVDLGKVAMDSLQNSEGGIVSGTAINVKLDCGGTAEGLNFVKMKFDPLSGSGVDLVNGSLLKTVGTATGVGIGVYNSENELLNLSANESITAPLVGEEVGEDETNYTADIVLRASYVASGGPVAPGTANGTLPFTLTYE